MSVITCRITKDAVELAADSQITCGIDKRAGFAYKKIEKIRDIYVGTVGTLHEAQFMHNYMEENPVPRNEKELRLYMVEYYRWRDNISPKINSTEDEVCGTRSFIVADMKVFFISMLYIDRVRTFHAIGSGEDYAMGAMHMGASAKEAALAACAYCTECYPPIQSIIISKKKMEGE